ncbi:MAG: tRNA dihydrouridine(20/20a) synthase DusA [Gammaproteobacteria bacterium]
MKCDLLSVAPMMDYTDRHCRYFLRLLSRKIRLYTEMVTTQAILRGNRQKILGYDAAEHPLALQLGGSEPDQLQQCAKIAADYGYDEINLNVGCPSHRVQAGRFGACLLKEPQLVAECVAAMKNAVDLPITVKTRIGVDECDSYEHLWHFITTVAAAGCNTFVVHARKAWLKGLSPKENREIPPLNYDWVYRLKRDFPNLGIVLNGGVKNFQQIHTHLLQVDGVMIGREAYRNAYLLANLDQVFYGVQRSVISRVDLVEEYLPYIEQKLAEGTPFSLLSRPMIGLFQGTQGARYWRRNLTTVKNPSLFQSLRSFRISKYTHYTSREEILMSRLPEIETF